MGSAEQDQGSHGEGGGGGGGEELEFTSTIISALSAGGEDGGGVQLKELRRSVLRSAKLRDDDKAGKKRFKRAVQALEAGGRLSLSEGGVITLLLAQPEEGSDGRKKKHKTKKKEKKKSKNEKKKERKRSRDEDEPSQSADFETGDPGDAPNKRRARDTGDDNDDDGMARKGPLEVEKEATATDHTAAGGADVDDQDKDGDDEDKNKPCSGNPEGVTRLFVGNLPFAVDDSSLGAHLAPAGEMTHVKWITDKETGKFYGSAFVEMKHSRAAAAAVEMAGSQLGGRPIKINYAPARPGDVWPPRSKTVTGGQAGGARGVRTMSEKPEGCHKLFIGNLSYELDDDGIFKFFAGVDAEVRAVRWLHHRDTGDFKGCGFVEFWSTDACERAATLNGKSLLGRPIRIDWSD